jgi:serine/threonine-protein kinase
MELVPGETLQQLLARRGALSPALACEIMLQILAGLDAAHRLGIVHRDLKPCNIVVTHLGPDAPLVKILDFGIGKGALGLAGAEGMLDLLEAPTYMAPEQVRSAEVGPLVDIYSAGVILYEMLAGEHPFTGDTDQVLQKVTLGRWKPLSAVNPAVPRLLALAVGAAMSADPARRLLSAPLFARQLAPHVSHAPQSVPYRPNSADAVLLRAASHTPEIKFMPTTDLTDLKRPPRDFPSLHLAKIAGTPKGEPLTDSLLQSPVIPRAPTAPNIHSMGIREVEMWSNAPAAMPADPAPSDAPGELGNPFTNDLGDSLFDTLSPADPASPDPRQVVAWQRGVLAAAVGAGAAAVLAWLYRFG